MEVVRNISAVHTTIKDYYDSVPVENVIIRRAYVFLDTDGDGYTDDIDAFPNDPAAAIDTDGDGFPDAWNPGKIEMDSTSGLTLDEFPTDPTKWEAKKPEEEEKESPGFLPGFEMLILFCAFGIIVMIHKNRMLKNR
jgi:hypothetical protein